VEEVGEVKKAERVGKVGGLVANTSVDWLK